MNLYTSLSRLFPTRPAPADPRRLVLILPCRLLLRGREPTTGRGVGVALHLKPHEPLPLPSPSVPAATRARRSPAHRADPAVLHRRRDSGDGDAQGAAPRLS